MNTENQHFSQTKLGASPCSLRAPPLDKYSTTFSTPFILHSLFSKIMSDSGNSLTSFIPLSTSAVTLLSPSPTVLEDYIFPFLGKGTPILKFFPIHEQSISSCLLAQAPQPSETFSWPCDSSRGTALFYSACSLISNNQHVRKMVRIITVFIVIPINMKNNFCAIKEIRY